MMVCLGVLKEVEVNFRKLPVIQNYPFFIGPGLRHAQGSFSGQTNAARPAYAVVNKSSKSQKNRKSVHRPSLSQSHPNLPTSGAKRVARKSRDDANQDFMSTPESGVCG